MTGQDATDERRLAAAVGPHVDLEDVRMEGLAFNLVRDPSSVPLDVEIRTATEFESRDEKVRFQCGFDVQVTESVDDDERQKILTAHLGFVVFYALVSDSGAELSEQQWTAFGNTSVPFTLHPYLRERLDALTSWAGLPRLVLGTARLPLPVDDGSRR